MSSFLTDLTAYSFLQYAFLTAVLCSFASGVVGSFVTVKRITSIAGAIAHSTIGGLGIALYLNQECGWDFLTPLHGTFFSAILSALIIGFLTLYGKQREDTVLSSIWSIGMAIGLFFISKTSGYNQDLLSYLFGNILMVTQKDLILIGILDFVILFISILFYHKFLAICFDEEFARLRGIHTGFYSVLLYLLTALTVIMLIQVVGIVMVIALLTLPQAISSEFSKKLWHMILYSILISIFCSLSGLFLSYQYDLPPGAMIVLIAGLLYFIVVSLKCFKLFPFFT